MSYENNIDISYPGPDWVMSFPHTLDRVQLDIVGFLAILGESSILANAQVSALSRLFYLPRLLPAPQALLRVTRPATLPSVTASVTSVSSGNKKEHIHHVASILLGTSSSELKKHWVRCVRVTKKLHTAAAAGPRWSDRLFRGQPRREKDDQGHLKEYVPATVKAKAAGPLTWVTLLGVALTVTIIIASFVWGDGMSLTAAISLSLLSSVCGIANKWELSLTTPPKRDKPSPEDSVVIRYPNGSFLVVKCNDEVARELFFAPEEINYTVKSSQVYRVLALVGSIMLMVGVILLANAKLQLQLGWAAAYLILNAAHWAAAALPPRMHWDLDCYELKEEGIENGPKNSSFTEALWKVILVTKEVEWVRFGNASPNTKAWDDWAKEASRAAKRAPPVLHDQELVDPCRSWPGNDGRGKVYSLPKSPIFDARAVYDQKSELAKEERAQREAEEGESSTGPLPGTQATAGAAQPLNSENGHAG